MKKAVFAGTFDPFTKGHYEITSDATEMFDCVVVAVAEKSKSGVSSDDRVKIARQSLSKIPNVEIMTFSGLLTDYLRSVNATILVRGLRNTIDFEYEKNLAAFYKQMMPELQICYFISGSDKDFISSTQIREILALRGNVDSYIIKEAKVLIEELYGVK